MTVPVFAYVLLKLASRCNIDCSYCYWFRDEDVYKKPAVLTPEAEAAFCERLEEHVQDYQLSEFTVLMHGGEPLLFPKHRFQRFVAKLKEIEARTGCVLDCIISTNATLVDGDWASLLNRYNVGVSVSVDGPPQIHDLHRKDFKGKGTHLEALRGFRLLQDAGIDPGIIAVCNPETDPALLLDYFVNELGVRRFDILPPDATHDDKPANIDTYFKRLFDVWFDEYAAQMIRIRILDGIVQGLFGSIAITDSIGCGAVHTVTVLTDGSIEPLDVLRIAGTGSTASSLNILRDTFQDVQKDQVWMEAFNASVSLCQACRNCEFLECCGGGHLAHRWSTTRRYDNPSVYCESWKSIFRHAWDRIAPTLIAS